MSQNAELNDKQDSKPDSGNPSRERYRLWVWWLVACNVLALILLFVFASEIKDYKDWASLIVLGLFSLSSLDVVIISALTSREMVEIMSRQEAEMTAQREAMQDQLATMKSQGESFNKQIDLMVRNECAYLGVRDWRVLDGNDLIVSGTIFNGGRTPAWNFNRQFQVATGTGTPPDDWGIIQWDKPTLGSGDSLIIAGGETYFSTDPTPITKETWMELIRGQQIILLDGECVYADTAGRKWVYRFGYTIDIQRSGFPVAVERYQRHQEYDAN